MKKDIDIKAWANELLEKGEAAAREQGLRGIGYFCSYVPEEILSVPGLYAFRMRGPNNMTTELADSYMGIFNCSYTRCMLETILDRGEGWLSGFVFTASCDHLRRLYDNLRYAAKPEFCHILDLPHKTHEDAKAWYAQELMILRDKLREGFKIDIRDDDLRTAIALCNENRRLVSSLAKLRESDQPPLTGEDMQRILMCSASLPKSVVNPALAELLSEIERNELTKKYRARVMLMGSQLDDPEYVAAIEERGALVVADGYCAGSLHYLGLSADEAEPLKAMAGRYLDKIPCPRMFEAYPERYRRIKETARQYRVHGIIVQSMKFCDCWGIEANVFLNNLRDDGFHVLRLEREYTLGGVGQLRTRVQAFLESMGC